MAAPQVELGFTLPPIKGEQPRPPELRYPSVKILFNGQGRGAADLFHALLDEGHEVVGVIASTKRDKEGKLDPLRQAVVNLNEIKNDAGFAPIPLINLADANEHEAQKKMRRLKPELGVSLFLQKILEPETLDIPTHGTLNTHYSLLPDERGRDAMQRNIKDGRKILGVTVFVMTKEVDAGPVAGYFAYENDGRSQGAQYFAHQEDVVELNRRVVNNIAWAINAQREVEKPELPLIEQDHSQATKHEPLTIDEMKIDLKNMTAEEIKNTILAGGPGAWIPKPGELAVFLLKPAVIESTTNRKPGEVVEVTDKGLVIATKEKDILIGQLREEVAGIRQNPMPADKFRFSFDDLPIASVDS